MNPDGYTSAHEYVSDQLDIARLRLERVANQAQLDLLPAHAQGGAALTAAIEQARVAIGASVAAMEGRIAKTSARFPALYLRDRLMLTETEEAVAWLLAAIEIDPGAAALRSLLEPTTT